MTRHVWIKMMCILVSFLLENGVENSPISDFFTLPERKWILLILIIFWRLSILLF